MVIQKILDSYYNMGVLKFKERKAKRPKGRRPESVAEVIYSAQQWAWLLWSECNLKFNPLRIAAMLSVSKLCSESTGIVVLLGDIQKQNFIFSLISEFNEGKTEDACFAKFCKEVAEGQCNICRLQELEAIPVDKVNNLINVYGILDTLKPKIRQGVINWNITDIRRESIAEHVYSVQQLAWLMWLATDEELDILKIIGTLSIHEVEETIIGDITPYSGITPEQKRQMGKEAVKQVLGSLNKYEYMHSLINEFDDEETPNAFFAHLCDKLDCDLAIKFYSDCGYCSIENATPAMKNNSKIQKLILDGAETVADVFIMADEHMYTGTFFEEVINAVKKKDTSKYSQIDL